MTAGVNQRGRINGMNTLSNNGMHVDVHRIMKKAAKKAAILAGTADASNGARHLKGPGDQVRSGWRKAV